ncbi:nuclear pore complex protein Nup98-Nup96-like isoform X2 [Montipora foliosa]|uniref:nuclear pore complex protein Nup98-Nup96-like isoform X2 n=1 Tax=Montipora foliosa TaxID=591990 RepID=UPI0035F215B0
MGTPTPFQVTTEEESMVKNGINCTIEGRHQTITVMGIYADKSIDELRFQDYEYKNVNQGDGKATLTPFSAGDASVACKPASSTCQSDPSTCRPLPWAFPVHVGSNTTSSSDVKSVPAHQH